MLLKTRVSSFERVPKTMLVWYCWHSICILIWWIHWYSNYVMVPTSYPALFCRALPCNIGESSALHLIFSLKSMIVEAFWVFTCLGKRLKCLFNLFYNFWGVFIVSCLGSGSFTLGYTYTVRLIYK